MPRKTPKPQDPIAKAWKEAKQTREAIVNKYKIEKLDAKRTCPKCGDLIMVWSDTLENFDPWHVRCFKCGTCDILEGIPAYDNDEDQYYTSFRDRFLSEMKDDVIVEGKNIIWKEEVDKDLVHYCCGKRYVMPREDFERERQHVWNEARWEARLHARQMRAWDWP